MSNNETYIKNLHTYCKKCHATLTGAGKTRDSSNSNGKIYFACNSTVLVEISQVLLFMRN